MRGCGECHGNPVSGGISPVTDLRAGHFNGLRSIDHPGRQLIHSPPCHPGLPGAHPGWQRGPDLPDVPQYPRRRLRGGGRQPDLQRHPLGAAHRIPGHYRQAVRWWRRPAPFASAASAGRISTPACCRSPATSTSTRWGSPTSSTASRTSRWKTARTATSYPDAHRARPDHAIRRPTPKTTGTTWRPLPVHAGHQSAGPGPHHRRGEHRLDPLLQAACSVCHTRNITTAPAGTLINGGALQGLGGARKQGLPSLRRLHAPRRGDGGRHRPERRTGHPEHGPDGATLGRAHTQPLDARRPEPSLNDAILRHRA